MTKQEKVDKLRARLLELGQPIVIPAGEQEQPRNAGDNSRSDIIIHPFWVEE